jgi:hypothetical protein
MIQVHDSCCFCLQNKIMPSKAIVVTMDTMIDSIHLIFARDRASNESHSSDERETILARR